MVEGGREGGQPEADRLQKMRPSDSLLFSVFSRVTIANHSRSSRRNTVVSWRAGGSKSTWMDKEAAEEEDGG